MAKLITLKYSARCRKCQQTIPARERAFWTKGYGSVHVHCKKDEPAKPKPSADLHVSVMDYADIRDRFLAAASGDFSGTNKKRWEDHSRRWNEATESGWEGATLDNMKAWINRGFQVEGLRNVGADIDPERIGRKLRYAEEGEMQIDLMLSGFDYPFLQWDKREKKPGMQINVGVCFNAHTDVELIAAYTQWVAQVLFAIESQGIDPEVNLTMATTGTFSNGPRRHRTLIRVKKENEASDFANWSAMFSPGGFRMLGFSAEFLIGDREGWTVVSSLGQAASGKAWNVSWDAETRTLEISENMNQTSGEFPADEMSDKLRAIMAEISK
jgi:hypothetical protein